MDCCFSARGRWVERIPTEKEEKRKTEKTGLEFAGGTK